MTDAGGVDEGKGRVSAEELRRIAGLARLRPDDDETERLVRDLNRVLEHVAALERVEIGPSEEGDMAEGEPRLREEGLRPDPLHRSLSLLAPDWREGFFVVPRLPGVEGEVEE